MGRRRWRQGALVAALAGAPGCFAEPDTVDPVATDDAADDTSGGSSTGEGGGVFFDIYANVCGAGMLRRGSNAGPNGGESGMQCGAMSALGVINTIDPAQTPNGDAPLAVVFGMPAQAEAVMFIGNNQPLSLSEADAPQLRGQLDCLEGMTGSYTWAVLDVAFDEVDGPLTPAATGEFTCGDPTETLAVPLSTDGDRFFSFRVTVADGVQRAAVLSAPIITDEA
ncbi:MAG: hypothetical protein AAF721_30970 [Myxococcota bacterium]